jgi:hypothetical protein
MLSGDCRGLHQQLAAAFKTANPGPSLTSSATSGL